MSESEDRVQEALAAHLEHLEVGGPEPDVSHLAPEEQGRLQSLIGLLDQTEGIAFGRALDEQRDKLEATTEVGGRLVAVLRETLPAAARIANDPAATSIEVPGLRVAEGWIVGTFGGRIRVWLLAGEVALDELDESLRDLDRVFRVFPDTAAVALIDSHLSCLLILPEDCAPNIQVPRGSLVARRYRRPIHPVGEALSVFLRELIPSWEPMQGINERKGISVDVPPIVEERARRAIADQVAAGGRARKTNPKRKALTELGERETSEVANLVLEVHESRLTSDDVERALRRLATRR